LVWIRAWLSCYDLAKWLSHYLYFFSFSFSFELTTHKKCGKVSCHMIKSHEEYGKIVHRPCSSCISSVQKINEDSIEFSLSTWTWSRFKLSWLKSYMSVVRPMSGLLTILIVSLLQYVKVNPLGTLYEKDLNWAYNSFEHFYLNYYTKFLYALFNTLILDSSPQTL